METTNKSNYIFLQRVVFFSGIIAAFGVPLFVYFDPFGGWRWQPYNQIYDQMIVSIYIPLGLLLLAAARQPEKHQSLIRFMFWSSVTHGGVMLFHAVVHPIHRGHLIGDVSILLGALLIFTAMRMNRFALL
jgi:hypothetical protein